MPTPGQILVDGDANAAEMLGGAHTGELQDVRRADGTRRQDHLAAGLGALDVVRPRAATLEFDTNRSLTSNRMRRTSALVTT
jgi:hypothetical protein